MVYLKHNFIVVWLSACHWNISWTIWMQSVLSVEDQLMYSSSIDNLDLKVASSYKNYQLIFCTHHIFPMRFSFSVSHVPHDLIVLLTYDDGIYHAIFSGLLLLSIFSSKSCSQTRYVVPRNVKDQVLHSFKLTRNVREKL